MHVYTSLRGSRRNHATRHPLHDVMAKLTIVEEVLNDEAVLDGKETLAEESKGLASSFRWRSDLQLLLLLPLRREGNRSTR